MLQVFDGNDGNDGDILNDGDIFNDGCPFVGVLVTLKRVLPRKGGRIMQVQTETWKSSSEVGCE